MDEKGIRNLEFSIVHECLIACPVNFHPIISAV